MFNSFTRSFSFGRRWISVGLGYNPDSATLSLTTSFDARNEGNTVRITLSTTSIPNGTYIPYTITGISSSDLSSGSLTGNFIINSNSAFLDFTFAEDKTGEGNEVMVLTLDNHPAISKSVTINDTSVWDPTVLGSSLAAWIDASDGSSYTLDARNINDIISITDKSGTYSMSVGGTPQRITNALNGLPVFEFDGNGEYFQSTTYEAQASSGNHWAIGIFRFDTVNNTKNSFWSYETVTSPIRDYAISSGASNNTWPGELDLDGLSTNRISSTIGNLQSWNNLSLSQSQYYIVACFFNKKGNQIGLRVDGSDAFTPVSDYSNSIQTNQQLRLMRNRASVELAGKFAEFFAVADFPGTGGTDISTLQKAEGYLAHKWGLTGALPSSHPYKINEP